MSSTIAVDSRMLRHSGIGTYLSHLVAGLAKQSAGAQDIQYRFYGAPELLSQVLPDVSRDALVRFQSPIYSLREHWDFWRLPKRWDLWHCPHYNVPSVKKGKLVVTVHDLIHLVFQGKFFNAAQGWYARQSFAWVRAHADAVIAVSHHTKKDLVVRPGIPAEKITVIHEGVSDVFRHAENPATLEALRKKYGLAGKFVLYVGNLKPHKNVGQLARVFRDLRERGKIQETLVLVGRADPELIVRDRDLAAAATDPAVCFLPQVAEEDLPALYQAAGAVVLPSLYEGFGLVVLEAMACGTPVIISDRGSLPEIAGDAAEIFDPRADAHLADAIQKVTQDPRHRSDLSARGLARSRQFSWDRMVDETVGLYGQVMG